MGKGERGDRVALHGCVSAGTGRPQPPAALTPVSAGREYGGGEAGWYRGRGRLWTIGFAQMLVAAASTWQGKTAKRAQFFYGSFHERPCLLVVAANYDA